MPPRAGTGVGGLSTISNVQLSLHVSSDKIHSIKTVKSQERRAAQAKKRLLKSSSICSFVTVKTLALGMEVEDKGSCKAGRERFPQKREITGGCGGGRKKQTGPDPTPELPMHGGMDQWK